MSATGQDSPVPLAFDDTGGPGPTLVCLPMFATTRAMARLAYGPALAGAGLRELYPDLPGHGDSPPLSTPTSEAVLGAVLAFLDEHADGPVLLAGGSYGGYLAAAVARRAPERVRGLLLVCHGPRAATQDRDLSDLLDPTAEPGWLDAAPAELRKHYEVALGARTAAVVARVTQALTSGGPGDDAFRTALREGDGWALPDEADERPYDGPVTVLVGRSDRVVGHRDQLRTLERYPRATYVLADGAGHHLPLERPGLFRAVTQDWLSRCI